MDFDFIDQLAIKTQNHEQFLLNLVITAIIKVSNFGYIIIFSYFLFKEIGNN